ncbi:TonB-dependent receptor [Vibrio sp. qd031]|uniref:TonB-dependent hemoglobin/transferrin/lactoferrin family receptor n=1 Tax=Vibrio sp. qd031 TaxID=1603038 RepID=UPI000A107405|nr:TonB-dependent hemoglobin/transferrin/lactoferrin family receptor [Vibrio sp. qd031]ORT51079.1 TonB-dependent receptor [Vibrio sp. qd031]
MNNKTPLAVAILSALSTTAISTSLSAEEVFTMESVTVSATRSQKELEDTAASVAVISDDDIEQDMTRSVENLFDYTPGVTVEGEARQGVQSINVRGMEGNRIKILVDGVSQPNQFSNGSYSFINSGRVNVDTDLLKSVEVVKGSASSLQGSDAIGGVVAFTTKDPEDFLQGRDIGGHVKLNYSSADNSFGESVALANRFGDLETLVAYSRRDGEQIDNFGEPDPQDYDTNDLLVKLQYQLSDAHRLEFSGSYVNNNTSSEFSDPSYTDYTGDDRTTQTSLGLKHIWNLDQSFADSIEWQVNWLSKEENGITNRTSLGGSFFLPPAGNVQTKDYIYGDEGWSGDIQLDKSLYWGNSEHYIVYGASFSNKDIHNTNNEYNSINEDQVIYYMPSASETRYGFFVQDEITAGNWVVTPGLRFDSFQTSPGDTSENPSGNPDSDYQDFDDSAVTGRLGTVYSVNNENKVFAQISQGFRAPDFQELYYSFGNPMHGYISAPNPDLKAEESISYELGWRHNVAYSSSEIAVFYSEYDNFIDYQLVDGSFATMDAVYQSINIDEATIKGIEFSNQLLWNFMPVEGFSSRIAAAYSDGEDGEKNPLNSVNPWNAVFGVNYDAPQGTWGTSLKLVYTAAKDASDIYTEEGSDEILPIDSSTVLDLTAYYVPVNNLTLRAGVFNLTDQEYYKWNDVRGLTERDQDLTAARRNFALTAKYDF